MRNNEICPDCWYLQRGWYPGEAPREPDNLRDAARDAHPNARCPNHRSPVFIGNVCISGPESLGKFGPLGGPKDHPWRKS